MTSTTPARPVKPLAVSHRLQVGAMILCLTLTGCGSGDALPDDARTRSTDARIQERYGNPLSELPIDTLVVISPHSETIRREFEWAFCLSRAETTGRRVRIEWRDVGGGSSAIHKYLSNVYGRGAQSAGIDVLWGGGEFTFIPLAKDGFLEELTLPADVLENIPRQLGGVRFYDEQNQWVGSAVSAFGFLYNKGTLDRCGIAPPAKWDDLADPRFHGLVSLADPTQSGSAAAAYQMIVRSGESWPDGWAKLLRILANAKRFTGSAGAAANGPITGDAPVAACIDFYGTIRAAEAPEELIYISPRGQSSFTPDPIAILKNPPHRELAERFVAFVLSPRGQALWALRVGQPDGPVLSPLGRQPIRSDVYDTYAGSMLASIVNPYQSGQAMTLEGFRQGVDYGVLKQLVRAAAIDNAAALRSAAAVLVSRPHDEALLADFTRLPDNVATIEAMAATRQAMKDPTRSYEIVRDWQEFFQHKYDRIASAP